MGFEAGKQHTPDERLGAEILFQQTLANEDGVSTDGLIKYFENYGSTFRAWLESESGIKCINDYLDHKIEISGVIGKYKESDEYKSYKSSLH